MKISRERLSLSRPTSRQCLSHQLRVDVRIVNAAAKQAQRSEERFGIYDYLAAVYTTSQKWQAQGLSQYKTRELCQHLGIRLSRGSSIRALIEASFPSAGYKQISRWSRALRFAAEQDIPARKLCRFFTRNRGVAGVATLAAQSHRARKRMDRWL